MLEERSHPEQGFRACLGIVRLVKAFGAMRQEAATTPGARRKVRRDQFIPDDSFGIRER
jgi:hypothetical protein